MDCRKLHRIVIALVLISPLAQASVYQWRDEQGRLHFSDKPPVNDDSTSLYATAEPESRSGVVDFQRVDFKLSEAADQQVREGLNAILSLYTSALGLDVRGDISVKLSQIESKKEFDLWLTERTGEPVGGLVSGVYVTATKEVAVWNWASEERVVQTILHESSHVILAQLAPRAPSWIHEGMAQYVQMLQRRNNAIEIVPYPAAAARIRNWVEGGELVSLRSYLNLPEQRWREMAHNMDAVPYSIAWGMVYFMMSSPIGQQTLRRILHDMEKSGQWPTADAIDARYPGGLVKMDYDFFRWAQSAMAAHRY
ncbi:MAG: DUF4124 domain-containing protein [Alcanivoracaceae bacterium]|jgi:hypothetical protein|nr:DUF4124 domain-containing protein [Alcanivoracaceae bacterium]